MADWIRTPFGMVSGVGRGMGVLDGRGDRRKGRGSFVTSGDGNALLQNYFGGICLRF